MSESEFIEMKFSDLKVGQKVKARAVVQEVKMDSKNSTPKWWLLSLFDGTATIRVFFKEDPGYKKDDVIDMEFETKKGKEYQGKPQLNFTVKTHELSKSKTSIERNINKIETLKGDSKNIRVIGKTIEISEIRKIRSKDGSEHEVGDLLIADETGCIILTLWDDDLQKITGYNVIEIDNGYVNVFKDIKKLNVGKFGTMKEITEEKEIARYITGELNTDNNISSA